MHANVVQAAAKTAGPTAVDARRKSAAGAAAPSAAAAARYAWSMCKE